MEWISVNRYLPNYSDSVLVYKKNYMAIAWRHCTDINGDQWASEECDFDAHGIVTHWMKLPDPPEKQISKLTGKDLTC